jgi:Tfp pilus assembly protein PilZ
MCFRIIWRQVQESFVKDSNQQRDDKKVTERLVELIYGASVAQRQALLSVLEKGWEHTVRRKHSRKKCFIAVDCANGKRIFKDYIKNISLGGVFVEGRNAFATGQTMTLAFESPNNKSEPIKTTGRVAWTGSLGIGVEFMQADKDVQRFFDSLPG